MRSAQLDDQQQQHKKKSSLANGNQFQVSLAAILMFSDGNGPDWILISTFRHPARAGSFDQIIGLISEPPPPQKKEKEIHTFAEFDSIRLIKLIR